ncbi:hypothetical protein YC2023_112547 [Brassica napus]
MEEELRDMKARKAHYDMLHFVADAQQGIPKLCPCGSITKESVDEEDTYDYLPGKRYFICKDFEVCSVVSVAFWIHCCLTKFILLWQNDGMHFRQPWVMGVQQEVERLKIRVHEHEKLLRECDELKVSLMSVQAQVRMLLRRVSDLERVV